MDCTKAREVMWEEELSKEFFDHIESCPECKKAYELVKKTRTVLKTRDNMEGAVMKKIKKAERARKISLITKIAAVFVAVLAVGIFAKIIIDNGLERSDKAVSEDQITEEKNEEFSTGSNGNYGAVDDGLMDKDEVFKPSAPMEEPMFPAPEAPEETPAEAEPANPGSDAITEDSAKNDVVMFLNEYKDMNSLSAHTADIVVSGDNIKYAQEILEDYSPETYDSHLEIQGDFYFEVMKSLDSNGFEVIFSTSAETIRKTLIYFDSLLK